ncbi:MAG: hypothetical protein ACREUG_02000 [Steroidobacteraceae bacterium]
MGAVQSSVTEPVAVELLLDEELLDDELLEETLLEEEELAEDDAELEEDEAVLEDDVELSAAAPAAGVESDAVLPPPQAASSIMRPSDVTTALAAEGIWPITLPAISVLPPRRKRKPELA